MRNQKRKKLGNKNSRILGSIKYYYYLCNTLTKDEWLLENIKESEIKSELKVKLNYFENWDDLIEELEDGKIEEKLKEFQKNQDIKKSFRTFVTQQLT